MESFNMRTRLYPLGTLCVPAKQDLVEIASTFNLNEVEKLSTTDLQCYWTQNKKAVKDAYAAKSVQNMPCIDYNKKIKPQPLTEEESTRCLYSLVLKQPQSKLNKYIDLNAGEARCSKRPKIIIHDITIINMNISKIKESCMNSVLIENIDINVANFDLLECCKQVVANLLTTSFEEGYSVPQRSDMWQQIRRFRISGILTMGLYMKVMPLALYRKNLSGEYVDTAGFIICQKFPWLGFSPDGIVFGRNGPIRLLEIKCPYSGVNCVINILFRKKATVSINT
ncbi:hypothetical protein NQ315_017449 [Exocentrus adspersus]|uniref:YqaJ viral recombinase domain-containing protein n=1 Tax=Exocentrus adspersus TaxID=1586481 RepID=A0AAV8VKI8_9CUCU|nr:hypothetical protein NQ315_017449 [Exocentrus adspersus]